MTLTPFALVRLAVGAAVLSALSYTWADPDLWGHVLFGADIVRSGIIPSIDPYSFTSDRPWVNHEWLAEVLMYGAYRWGGPKGLVALKLTILLALAAIVIRVARRDRLSPIAQDVLLGVALVGSSARILPVRPQLFSLVLFGLLLWLLTEADRGRRTRLLAVPLVMAAWVNLHGGWIVGAAVVGVWCADRLIRQPAPAPERWHVVALAAAALGATLLNPYGLGLWGFLWATVGLGRPYISDWLPLSSSGLLIVSWSITAVVGGLAAVKTRRHPDPAWLVVIVALGLATVRVNRLDAFFALSVTCVLARQIGALITGSDAPSSADVERPTRSIAIALTVAAVIVVTAATGKVVTNAACLTTEATDLPENEALEFFEARQIRGRTITWFNWGEYAIWHLAPAVQVSMDGRRETTYSAELIDAHMRMYLGEVGGLERLLALEPDYIWLPRRLPMVEGLSRQGWTVLFEGPLSTVLGRTAGEGPVSRVENGRVPACFPGP